MSARRFPAGLGARGVRGAAALALVACALATAGCGQRTRIEGAPPADSTRAVPPDSARRLLRDAQSSWEDPDAGEGAARASATALLADLRARHPEEWEARSRTLLDSLAIGAEVAGTPGMVAVNFFSRADPDGGSWPWLYWNDGKQTHSQAIEGTGLHLLSMVSRRGVGSAAGLAILFGRRAGGGQQPLAMAWGHPKPEAPWSLAQTLGPDSLGGTGTAEFQAVSDSAADVVARTYTVTRGFDECAMCPHIYRTRRFHWGAAGFARIEELPVVSPYSTFVEFVQALAAGDLDAAARRVADSSLLDRARKLEWNRGKGLWRVAPETDETAQQMVFFRGKDEAYRVEFAPRGTDWVITAFEPTTRTIE
jgi:hypothetical protein